ncbi:MAG: AMP-binding protein, partial [Candidatus Entotheonellia bacterium]
MTQDHDTLPKLLLANAQRSGSQKAAIREKQYGIWQSYSWSQYLAQVKDFATGLANLDIQPGDKVAIIGDNRPQLYWALVAAQALGGIPVPLYQDAIASEIHFILQHSDARVVVAEDQEQVDKILEMKDRLPEVEYVIYDDPTGMRHYAYPFLMSFTEVQDLGRRFQQRRRDAFEAAVAQGGPEDLAIINYTSGTTGAPKGVMLTHANLLATARNYLQVDPLDGGDEIMA